MARATLTSRCMQTIAARATNCAVCSDCRHALLQCRTIRRVVRLHTGCRSGIFPSFPLSTPFRNSESADNNDSFAPPIRGNEGVKIDNAALPADTKTREDLKFIFFPFRLSIFRLYSFLARWERATSARRAQTPIFTRGLRYGVKRA